MKKLLSALLVLVMLLSFIPAAQGIYGVPFCKNKGLAARYAQVIKKVILSLSEGSFPRNGASIKDSSVCGFGMT